jgi:hypothetical protein
MLSTFFFTCVDRETYKIMLESMMKSLCTQKKKKRSYLCLTITHHYQHCAHDKQCKQKIEESASFYRNIQRLKQRKKNSYTLQE